jgi:hypothetical protein
MVKKNVGRFVYWTPRILSIVFILFLAIFSFDVFGNGYAFWETVLALFIHNIPSLLLLGVLIISWKHEIVGGIAFILAGLLYIISILINTLKGPFEWYMLSYSFIIAGPAIFIGILFLIGWKRKKKHAKR